MPRVSICLATYNGERFLKAQIESLRAQTFDDFELVVSDGGSTDSTCAILADYARSDPRIRILPPAGRLDVRLNFERVIRAAQARYIATCDQDDIWHPDKIAASLECLQARQVALVYCDSAFIDEEGRASGGTLLQMLPLAIEGHDPRPFAFGNCVSGHAMLFDRALLAHALPFPEELIYDWWIATVAAASGGIALLDRPLVQYRTHANSATNLILHVEAAKFQHDVRLTNAEECRRFAVFARVPGQAGRDYARLKKLWGLLATRTVVPALAVFLLRHPTFLAMRHKPAHRTAWRIVKLARGLGWRERSLARRARRHAKKKAQT